MFSKITDFFNSLSQQSASSAVDEYHLAIAALLCEVSNADHNISREEELVIERTLAKLLGIDNQQVVSLLKEAKQKIAASSSLYDFTSQLAELEFRTRSRLIEAMWEVAYADNELDPVEELVIRKVSDLLYLDHSEYIQAKLAVVNS